MSQYPVTLPDAVLDEVRHAATEEHTSVDELLGALIVNGLEQRQGAKMMAERARRADPDTALALLRSLPSLPTEPWDEMPAAKAGDHVAAKP
jgi:hypothetical protein